MKELILEAKFDDDLSLLQSLSGYYSFKKNIHYVVCKRAGGKMKKGKNYVMKNEKRVNKSINKIEFDTKSYSLLHILTHSRFHQSTLRPQPLSL